LKTSEKALTTAFLTILLLSPLSPLLIQTTHAQPTSATLTDLNGWKKFETDIITIMFPADGRHPIFLWWYTKQNDTIYTVHYKGLIEYYLPKIGAPFTHKYASEVARLMQAFIKQNYENLQKGFRILNQVENRYTGINGTFHQLGQMIVTLSQSNIEEALELIEELHDKASKIAEEAQTIDEEGLNTEAQEALNKIDSLQEKLEEFAEDGKPSQIIHEIQEVIKSMKELVKTQIQVIRSRIQENIHKRIQIGEILRQLRNRLHPPFFPFFNGRWELIPPQEINNTEGTPIGVSFAFNLTHVHNPWWEFAEGNILIKCRFYYVPVTESTSSISYTVGPAEMKMDFIINHWEWNIDAITDLIEYLNEEFGTDIPTPNVQRAGLALWLDLTSLNASRIPNLLEIGDTVEKIGNTTSLKNSLAKIIDASNELIETLEAGYGEFTEAYEEILKELTADPPDWTDIHEEVLDIIDDSIEDVTEELNETQLIINEALSLIEDIVDSETYADIEEHVSKILSSTSNTIDSLKTINETLTNLQDIENTTTFNETLTEALEDYEDLVTQLKNSITDELEELHETLTSKTNEIVNNAVATRIRIKDKIMNIQQDRSGEDERPVDVPIGLGKLLKIGFATENTTLAGWFQFVNFTNLTYPNGTESTAPVKAAYLEAGAHLRLYMLYRYFDNATLNHDPSIGLTVPETSTPEATKPQYNVKVPTGSQITPQEVIRIILPLVTPELILILVGTASIIAIVIGVAKWKRKVINIVGVS
jgi:hypothetical protein